MAGRSTAVATIDRARSVAPRFTPEQVALIKSQFAAGATDDEFAVFLAVAQKFELDPIAREVWCIKRKADDPAQIMVGRDGLLAIAERSGHFDGLVSGVVKEGDTFEFGLREPTHRFGETRGKLLGGYAYVYRSDRQYPFHVFAEWAEHGAPITRDKDGKRINLWSPWSKYPSAMIRKTAEAQALRLAFRVSGVVAEGSEADDYVDGEVIEDPPPAEGASSSLPRQAQQPKADVGSAQPEEENLFDPAAAEAAAAPEDGGWEDVS